MMPPEPMAVCVFTHSRPDYLSKLVKTLTAQSHREACHYHVFQDGAKNLFSGRITCSNDTVREVTLQAMRADFPIKHIHIRGHNAGIAIQQYEAYDYIAQRFRWAVFLDDDVVLSPHFLRICRLLTRFLDEDKDAFSATPSFQRFCTLDEMNDRLTHVEVGGSPWIGYVADLSKWQRLEYKYHEYYAFVADRDYRTRPHAEIRKWYEAVGWKGKASSQDGGKEASLHAVGMHRLRCVVNRGFYIGEQGEHGSPGLYKQQGWENFKPFEHAGDATIALERV